MSDVINWTPRMLEDFKFRYKKCLTESGAIKQDTFVFDGREFVTGYAKYLIEYLESVFK